MFVSVWIVRRFLSFVSHRDTHIARAPIMPSSLSPVIVIVAIDITPAVDQSIVSDFFMGRKSPIVMIVVCTGYSV